LQTLLVTVEDLMPKVIDEDRVFSVATTLFVRHGYEGTKTKDIAEAAGINEATLFRRYGDKASLLAKAIDHQWVDVPLADLGPSDDLEADLIAAVDAYLETNRRRGAIVPALLVELARGTDLRGAFEAASTNIRGLIEIVGHHQAAGRLRPEQPMITLVALIGPLLALEMFRRASMADAASTIDPGSYVQAFLEGRRPSAPQSDDQSDRT
jgi:AcrR family transcriptional regulator